MKSIELFPHNEKAYELLIAKLKTSRFATINHATGTGKSFIALKYLFEKRNKKYLYIAPTYPIIDQLMESCYGVGITPKDLNVDTMIYRNLLNMDMKALFNKYDGFILDEYHRTGAKETYKKIKELKLLIEQSNKSMIGLTATPIRYLDDERNMTEEIFNGEVASSISLAEAMLEGLLPVPTYINSKISCREYYQKTLERVNKLEGGEEKEELIEELSEISREKIGSAETDYQELIKNYIQEKNGKYTLFCSSIEEVQKYYDIVDKWFEHLGGVKKYQVHSKQTKEKNKESLQNFNEDSEGISLLFCVDILNEGVHVKNIDGVIMLRQTTSPIIYFQQIGRALSFSGRKKQIKILDLVNNFANHDAIYAVYNEVKAELQRKIELNPEKKEQYESVLNKFIILDETYDIIDSLEKINAKLTKEKIIESRIEHAIETLAVCSEMQLSLENELKMLEANLTLKRYYKYVTNEQLDRLFDLDVLLPDELMIGAEERKEMLQEYNSIYEKEKNDFSDISLLIKFININHRTPDMASMYTSEKNLGNIYANFLIYASKEQKEKMIKALKQEKIEIKSWEKVLLGLKFKEDDINDLIRLSNEFLEKSTVLPNYLYEALSACLIRIDKLDLTKEIGEALRKADVIYKFSLKSKAEKEQEVKEILKIVEDKIETLDDDKILDELKDKLLTLEPKYQQYIKRKIKHIRKKFYKGKIKLSDYKETKAFFTRMKYASRDEIENEYSKLLVDENINQTILELLNFKRTNKRMPNVKSNNEQERKLATLLEYYVEIGRIDNTIISSLTKTDNIFGDGLAKAAEDNIKDIKSRKRSFCWQYKKTKKQIYKSGLHTDNEKECRSFCVRMRTATLREIIEQYTILQENEALNNFILELIEFIRLNQGNLPSVESQNNNEVRLAIQLNNYVESGRIDRSIVKDLETLGVLPTTLLENISTSSLKKIHYTKSYFKSKYKDERERVYKIKCRKNEEIRISGKNIELSEEEFAEWYDDLEIEKLVNDVIVEIIKFKSENNGRLPSLESKNKEEALLASKLEYYINIGKIDEGDMIFEGVSIIELEQINDKAYLEFSKDNLELLNNEEEVLKAKYERTRKEICRKIINFNDNLDLQSFCVTMRSVSENDIEAFRSKLSADKEINECIYNVIKFRKLNEGKLPSQQSSNEEEIKLAEVFEEYIQTGVFDERLLKYMEISAKAQEFSKLYEIKEHVFNDTIVENLNDIKVKTIILQVVEFFIKNGRRPLSNSKNPEEASIANEYDKNIKIYLTEDCLRSLNKMFNSRKNLSRTCDEYLKNILDNRG